MGTREIKEINVTIGKMLKDAREKHGSSQAGMCETTGLTKNHISDVERGLSQASIKMLIGYCEKLGITPNDILGYDNIDMVPELKEVLSEMDQVQQQKILDMIRLMLK